MEICSHTLIPLFMPGSVHSGSASWDDCGWMFPDKLGVSLFPDRFPHYAWTAAGLDVVRPLQLHWAKVYACVGVTCHLHILQNDWGLSHATAVTQGWKGHRIRVSTGSLLWRRRVNSEVVGESTKVIFGQKHTYWSRSKILIHSSWLTSFCLEKFGRETQLTELARLTVTLTRGRVLHVCPFSFLTSLQSWGLLMAQVEPEDST